MYSLEKEHPRSYIQVVHRVQEKYTSSNDKEDFIESKLEMLPIALEVIERHELTEHTFTPTKITREMRVKTVKIFQAVKIHTFTRT